MVVYTMSSVGMRMPDMHCGEDMQRVQVAETHRCTYGRDPEFLQSYTYPRSGGRNFEEGTSERETKNASTGLEIRTRFDGSRTGTGSETAAPAGVCCGNPAREPTKTGCRTSRSSVGACDSPRSFVRPPCQPSTRSSLPQTQSFPIPLPKSSHGYQDSTTRDHEETAAASCGDEHVEREHFDHFVLEPELDHAPAVGRRAAPERPRICSPTGQATRPAPGMRRMRSYHPVTDQRAYRSAGKAF
ncbi:hypothetical protein C8Q73DRAFT_688477 [Cubamyces lactineus]|nr:hypothetical protein C8Q73DRAFT_688477 [Cubamyces lactineus]